MKIGYFYLILLIVMLLGISSTVALVKYTEYLSSKASITSYISNEE